MCVCVCLIARVRALSPPSQPPTKLLYVNQLMRPYSRVQLLELLNKDGPISQELFWTNNIKSYCIALVREMIGRWSGRGGGSLEGHDS